MNNSKRSILKTMVVGSAWTTPIVRGIVLPAHAALSQCSLSIEYLAFLPPTYSAGIFHSLYNDQECLDTSGDFFFPEDATTIDSICYQLEPGETYYLVLAPGIGGDQNEGEGTLEVQVNCGAQSFDASESFAAIVNIGIDGSCDLTVVNSEADLPDNPCQS